MNTLFHGVLGACNLRGMLPAVVGCGFLSGEACSVVVVGDFAGCDGVCGVMAVNWMSQGFFRRKGSEGSFWWMDYGWRCNLLRCFAGDQ